MWMRTMQPWGPWSVNDPLSDHRFRALAQELSPFEYEAMCWRVAQYMMIAGATSQVIARVTRLPHEEIVEMMDAIEALGAAGV